MAENAHTEPLVKLSEPLSGENNKKKRTRRGHRGGVGHKKPVVPSVENFLNGATENLKVESRRRQPRRPKVPDREFEPAENAVNFLSKAVENLNIVEPRNIRGADSTSQSKKKPRNRERIESVNQSPRAQSFQGNNRQNQDRNRPDKNKYADYMSEDLVRRLLSTQSKDRLEYVEGNVRINPKCFKEAYVGLPGGEADLLIEGVQDRNRALEGDLVVVRINPKERWRGLKTQRPQKTGTVVYISEKIHPRKVVGFLKVMPDNNSRVALFSPKDHKVPRLNIDQETWPENFFQNPEAYANTMFLADILAWNDVRFAKGKILTRIGEAGDLKAESAAILLEWNLDVSPYTGELTRDLPPSDYQPTAEDIEGREDLRKECVFTIDPATARDLDDALSCKPLENGNYEVGVHISDVTHYLKAFSPLDKEVSKRATTVYMTDAVYHMLPKQLCNVCSLLPGAEKLAFSITFEISPEGEVVGHRFSKTVINSCCQLAYEHAQVMITTPDKEWSAEEHPEIKGPYRISQISAVVNNLNNLAVKMRQKRIDDGTLRIDQPKLHVLVDWETGTPVSFTLDEQKDSNRLIEEFMLLANMTAATHLYKNLPNHALLRRHDPPQMHMLVESQAMLEKLGIHIDIESAGELAASLNRYRPDPYATSETELYLATCRFKVLNALCSKPMMRAKYFCTAADMVDDNLRHYALNVPLYTHFTSPIRRYPDCVVHRLLYASITDAVPIPRWTPRLCASIANNCNVKKYYAKRAQETCSELYLACLLGLKGPVDSDVIAIDVKDRSLDVLVYNMGINLRIYFAEIEKFASINHDKTDDIQTLTIHWNKSKATQVINVFSVMKVRVSKHPDGFRFHGELLEPEQTGF